MGTFELQYLSLKKILTNSIVEKHSCFFFLITLIKISGKVLPSLNWFEGRVR